MITKVMSIRTTAQKHNDHTGRKVLKRLSTCIDLVAEEGRYHDDCEKKFSRGEISKSTKRGRPLDEDIDEAMNYIFYKLEEGDDCQYSLDELREDYVGYMPSPQTIKRRLEEKFGENIVVVSMQNREPTVCLRKTGAKILSDHWYTGKLDNNFDERLRIVRTAARIIKEDIHEKVFVSVIFKDVIRTTSY